MTDAKNEAPGARLVVVGGEKKRSKYRADIDGMRTLAVAAVIAFHVDEEKYESGFVGVDIFFVISGYVVLSSLLHKPEGDAWTYYGAFYARRLKRLMPTLLLAVFATGSEQGGTRVLHCPFSPWEESKKPDHHESQTNSHGLQTVTRTKRREGR